MNKKVICINPDSKLSRIVPHTTHDNDSHLDRYVFFYEKDIVFIQIVQKHINYTYVKEKSLTKNSMKTCISKMWPEVNEVRKINRSDFVITTMKTFDLTLN